MKHDDYPSAVALLMTFSMIINENLVARTFGSCSAKAFNIDSGNLCVPALAMGLVVFAFDVNIAGNSLIGAVSKLTSVPEVGGVLGFSLITLWATDLRIVLNASSDTSNTSVSGFVAAAALAILEYKGFTTITKRRRRNRFQAKHRTCDRDAHRGLLATAITLGVVVLLVSLTVKSTSDPLIIVIATACIGAIILLKFWILKRLRGDKGTTSHQPHS